MFLLFFFLQIFQLQFVRKLGQWRYLSHLKKNNVTEDCPICQTQPTEKVFIYTLHFYHLTG